MMVEIVDFCFEFFNEVIMRVNMKNCENYFSIYNCIGIKLYVYYCVINEFIDVFIEVCVEDMFINIGKLLFKIIKLIFILFFLILNKSFL